MKAKFRFTNPAAQPEGHVSALLVPAEGDGTVIPHGPLGINISAEDAAELQDGDIIEVTFAKSSEKEDEEDEE